MQLFPQQTYPQESDHINSLLNVVQDSQLCVFFILCLRERQSFGVGEFALLGTLRSNDTDGNKNFKKNNWFNK